MVFVSIYFQSSLSPYLNFLRVIIVSYVKSVLLLSILYPFLLMEDHVFRRNNLEILGGSQYKEKGFSEGGYYPKCNFLKGVTPGKIL